MAAVPDSALRLAAHVAKAYNRKSPPPIRWRQEKNRPGDRKGTTGAFHPHDGHISISTRGSNHISERRVLLHELAHWLTLRSSEHHGKYFWHTLWELYRRYRVPMRYALDIETSYGPRARRLLAYRVYRETGGRLSSPSI